MTEVQTCKVKSSAVEERIDGTTSQKMESSSNNESSGSSVEPDPATSSASLAPNNTSSSDSSSDEESPVVFKPQDQLSPAPWKFSRLTFPRQTRSQMKTLPFPLDLLQPRKPRHAGRTLLQQPEIPSLSDRVFLQTFSSQWAEKFVQGESLVFTQGVWWEGRRGFEEIGQSREGQCIEANE